MKHYYRINCNSDLGIKFRLFWHDCIKARTAAELFAKKVGAEAYYTLPTVFEGGVACVSFPAGTEVNKTIWRLLGRDIEDTDQYKPNVEHIKDVIMLPRKGFRPSDTARRIYAKKMSRWSEVRYLHSLTEWAQMAGVTLTDDKKKDAARVDEMMSSQTFCFYTELSHESIAKEHENDRRYKMPWVARESINIERARMKLPVVSTERLFHLLHADLLDGQPDDGKPKFIKPTTPTFFEWAGRYYIGIDYPCKHDDLEEITEGDYRLKMITLRQAEEAKRQEENN